MVRFEVKRIFKMIQQIAGYIQLRPLKCEAKWNDPIHPKENVQELLYNTGYRPTKNGT